MAYTIAVTGKGGTGKTTLTGFLIEYLGGLGNGPVLAVDADANANLNEVLGVPIEKTLGELRENIVNAEFDPDSPISPVTTKQDYLNASFSNAITEEDDYDLLVMGRTQGKGCYCFVNGLLQAQLQRFSNNYKYVVVDNEAGMEHLSRGILPGVDLILIVSDCSRRGVQAAARISELTAELGMKVADGVKLIINKAPGGELNAGILEEIEKYGFDLVGAVPLDDLVFEYDSNGTPTTKLPADAPARAAFTKIMADLPITKPIIK
ncbi:MAG: AAA family ATPase [Clostridiales Family XIII bacterium]|jgi:CO dehydrogenase maturation factor|nr:AAA family ATPase [Clostridiales Family XIII bacterium]